MNVILCGYGRMGAMLESLILPREDMDILGVVHPGLYDSALDVPGKADVIIDFSYPGNLEGILARAKRDGCAVVLGTTGLSEAQALAIRAASAEVPIVHASNFSLGVAVLRRAAAMAAGILKDSGFDIEIVETHHNQKVDAPSGTAKALLKAVDPEGDYAVVPGRNGIVGKRGREIGVHALRGGNVAGEHSVFFFGDDETLELRHSATSRKIFAVGALKAAAFAAGKAPGLYGIDDILF